MLREVWLPTIFRLSRCLLVNEKRIVDISVTKASRKLTAGRCVALIFLAIGFLYVGHVAISPQIAGWWFNSHVSIGLTRERVFEIVPKKYVSYLPDRYKVLDRILKDYWPKIDYSRASEVVVFYLSYDRLGIVLFSENGKVLERVVVRT